MPQIPGATMETQLKFLVDQQSINQVNSAIQQIKSTASKLLGTIGIGISLRSLNAVAEEYGAINDKIKAATKDLGDQQEIQDKILKAANETRVSYSSMATTVTKLVQQNKTLFADVESATNFAELTAKALQVAGASTAEIAQGQNLVNKAIAQGNMSATTYQQLLQSYPSLINTMADGLGKSTDELKAMAQAGTLTADKIVEAFNNASDQINEDFKNVRYTISDALRVIRDRWGNWVSDMDETLQLTQTIAKLLVDGFEKFMSVLDKVKTGVEWLSDKLGGTENVLKLLAIAAGAIFVAFHFDKIVKGIENIFKALSNPKLAVITAALIGIGLIIEDLVGFMQGKDSLFGVLLEKSGVDVDEFREKVKEGFDFIKEHITDIIQGIVAALGGLGTAFGIFKGFKGLTDVADGIGKFKDLFKGGLVPADAAGGLGKAAEGLEGAAGAATKAAAPMGAIIALIVLLVGAFVTLWMTSEDFREHITNAIQKVVDKVKEFAKAIQDRFADAGIQINGLGDVVELFKRGWTVLCDILAPVLEGAFDAIAGIISGLLDVILGIIDFIVGVFTGDWEQAWNGVCEIFYGLWEGIVGFFGGVIEAIVGFFASMVIGVENGGAELVQSMMDAFQEGIDWITALPEKAVQWGADIINGIKDGISGAIDTLTEPLSNVAGKISSFLHFSKPDEGPLSDFDTYMPDMIDLMASGIEGGRDQIQEAMSGLTGDISATAQVDANIPDIGTQLVESVQAAVPKIQQTLNQLMAGMQVMANANIVMPSTKMAATGSNNVSKSVNQNIEINNKFEGDRAGQEKSATAMNKAAKDSTAELARGLAYAR